LLVEQGYMTPLQAIESATRVSAGALGLSSETGTIERGKAADLVVVNGSLEKSLKPLLENVEAVFREGKRVR
jgi:imidazolonepropionase-like amidohydrolase